MGKIRKKYAKDWQYGIPTAYEVFGTRTIEVPTPHQGMKPQLQFLVYSMNKWLWVNADEYGPATTNQHEQAAAPHTGNRELYTVYHG